MVSKEFSDSRVRQGSKDYILGQCFFISLNNLCNYINGREGI